ncbi:hypothetical protein JOB18_039562 [Solea senegalensis]|uniref:Syntaxin N-terminal domain-containing protein n=1 Tax=Solea senegalensis TaxID=28829 RepID=A0AAV6RTE2_SOLSE|nr:hypothetical protein JOB18_039562 [Solea senegalensis]
MFSGGSGRVDHHQRWHRAEVSEDTLDTQDHMMKGGGVRGICVSVCEPATKTETKQQVHAELNLLHNDVLELVQSVQSVSKRTGEDGSRRAGSRCNLSLLFCQLRSSKSVFSETLTYAPLWQVSLQKSIISSLR